MELTEAIRAYVQEKLFPVSKLIDTRDDAMYADVELGRTTHHHHKGDVYRTELTLHSDGHTYRTVSEKNDLYASIDSMKDQILAEIKKSKGKREGFLRKGQQRLKAMVKGFFNKNNNGR